MKIIFEGFDWHFYIGWHKESWLHTYVKHFGYNKWLTIYLGFWTFVILWGGEG